jgi:DNA-binding CsgD family transcriptional regulator
MGDLIGRAEECAVLDGLLGSARAGMSGTLVLRGEPGIGKTALIDYAIAEAADMQVVVLGGIESEVELGFAALQRVLIPILHWIDRLPPSQRGALNAAFGLAGDKQPDRFMVGMAALTLAAESASRQPMLWVVDDAQWVDRESINAFAFCGRRFRADPVALIFAERDTPEASRALDGFPVLQLSGLAEPHAQALLAAVTESRLDPRVADRLISETAGNPLALAELGKELTSGQLTGAMALPEPLPLTRRLEERFLRQVRSLPASSQLLLLLAAAEPTGDPALLWSAAAVLGVSVDAAEGAEAANLLSLLPRVTFRHPLIRSAVYSGARAADRRRVHRALAEVTRGNIDADRRAWHQAAAAIRPDEEVAAALERSAVRASLQGGRSAEAAFLSRAADLTPSRGRAAERRVAAAAAAIAAGSALQAQSLLDVARPDLREPRMRANAERLMANSWTLLGRTSESVPILISAALGLRPFDTHLSRRTMLEAFEAAALSGALSVVPGDVARAAISDIDDSSDDGTVVDALLAALATYATAGYPAAVPLLRRAGTAMSADDVPPVVVIRWALLANLVTQALWDQAANQDLMSRLAALSRSVGSLHRLLVALHGCATAELWAGRIDLAEVHMAEAKELARAAGNPMSALMDLGITAWQGNDAEARATGEETLTLSAELGLGVVVSMVDLALLALDLGTGDYRAALGHARAVFDADPVGSGNLVLADMIEAAVRVDDREAATAALERLAERAPASGSDWALGLLARSQALLAADDTAELLYLEAIRRLELTGMAVEKARTRLLYGEWLRRQKRRADARDELRIAYNTFVTIGADGLAERARNELLATGEHARKRTVETSNDLTPQEAHVARLAAAGATNPEIAARLFISASTVEYHLRKVFRKLAVTSRRQLRHALPD